MKNWIPIDKGRRWEILIIFFLFLLITVLPLNFLSKMFFMVGLLWPYTLAEKSVETRVQTRRYKFSFLRAAFKLQTFFYFLLSNRSERYQRVFNGLARGLSPYFFSTILWFVALDGNPLFSILGHLCFELIRFKISKFQ